MKTMKVTRNKSFELSFGIHLGVLLLGFLPLAYEINQPVPVEYMVELGYEELPELQSSEQQM